MTKPTNAKPSAAAAGLPAMMAKSQIYRDYEKAFTVASGLRMNFKVPFSDSSDGPQTLGNEFCELIAQGRSGCARCLELQKQLETEAQLEPRTMKCFAGLCETAVPVRVGRKVVAFLETGHVFIDKPGRKGFSRVARQLLDWGVEVDLKKAEETWYATRVLSPVQYQAFAGMLHVFAHHLEMIGAGLAMKHGDDDPPAIRHARQFIVSHSGDDLTLAGVAQVVNLSADHLCKKFKQSTGLSFTEFVTEVRVEKARRLLRESGRRVNEVGFEAGFQSLSQFNRAFKKLVGRTPREYRDNPSV